MSVGIAFLSLPKSFEKQVIFDLNRVSFLFSDFDYNAINDYKIVQPLKWWDFGLNFKLESVLFIQ